MAIDTAAKRKSCIGIGLGFLRTGVIPDASNLEAAQRLHVQGFYSGIAASTPSESLIPMKSLVIDIGDMGMTLMPQGNTLPISIVTQTPTATPAGNKGVCFKISGGVLTIYGWDGAAWRANN